MIFVGLLLLAWSLFGCAVVIMMVYGAFEHVALNDPIMAAIVATGVGFLAALGLIVAGLQLRSVRGY